MKNKKGIIIMIFVLSIICISLISCMIILINKSDFSFKFNKSAKDIKIVDLFEADGASIDRIDFNLLSTDVQFKNSENDKLKIEYYSNKQKENIIRKENNQVYINEDNENVVCIGICFEYNKKIIVYIPTNYIGLVNIKTKSGDINSSIELIKNEVNITTSSGDISLNSVDKSKLYTKSGDIRINGDANILELKTNSGDIRINKINLAFSIKTTSGDVEIKSLNIINNSNIHTTSGNVNVIDNINEAYIEFKSSSGDSIINKSDRKSDIVLKVETTSGDLKVN